MEKVVGVSTSNAKFTAARLQFIRSGIRTFKLSSRSPTIEVLDPEVPVPALNAYAAGSDACKHRIMGVMWHRQLQGLEGMRVHADNKLATGRCASGASETRLHERRDGLLGERDLQIERLVCRVRERE